jgi:hypothetical protein
MLMARINVPLDKLEVTALVRMAEADCRHPRDQLRHLLREEARKRNLLPVEQVKEGAKEFSTTI